MQEKEENKMPDIKLPYNKAGMDMAETLEKEVESMGGEVSYDYPAEDAPSRVENYQYGGKIGETLQATGKFEYGGKVNSTLQATGKFGKGGKAKKKKKSHNWFEHGGQVEQDSAFAENAIGQGEGKVYKK